MNPAYHTTALPISAIIPRKKMVEPEADTTANTPIPPTDAGIVSVSTVLVSASAKPVTHHKRAIHLEDPKKIELKTPDNYHVLIENTADKTEKLKVIQGQAGLTPTLLITHGKDPQQTDATFVRLKGQDAFQFKSVSTNPTLTPELTTVSTTARLYKNGQGEGAVADEIPIKGLPDPLMVFYHEEGARPIVEAPLFSLGNTLALSLNQLPQQLVLRGADHHKANTETETLQQQWQPFLQVSENPKLHKRHAQKMEGIQTAVEDWYQQVHPDLLLKQANALPIPTPESLGIKIAICPEDAAPATALPTNPAKN